MLRKIYRELVKIRKELLEIKKISKPETLEISYANGKVVQTSLKSDKNFSLKPENTIYIDGQEIPTWQFVWLHLKRDQMKIHRNAVSIFLNAIAIAVTLIIAIIGLL